MANDRSLLLTTLTLVALLLSSVATPTSAAAAPRLQSPPPAHAMNLGVSVASIFKLGPGIALFNNVGTLAEQKLPKNHDGDDDNEIICPERRNGKSYCTEVPNYLEATQLHKLSTDEFEKFKYYFKDDFVQPTNVTNRMGDEPTESYFCDTKSRLIYPKVAETKESKWVMVVQHQKYRQGILVEQCENVDTPCKYDNLLPFGIQSRCKQHYVYRSLVVVNQGVLQERMVKLPSACKCALRNFKRI